MKAKKLKCQHNSMSPYKGYNIINVCDSFQIIYRWEKNEDANRNNIPIHNNNN